jgi:hypothetical protein
MACANGNSPKEKMMASINVALSPQEISDCEQAAMFRWQLARASGVVNQRRDDRSDNDIDLLGLKAELAVSKLFKIKHDVFRFGVDSGVDMWLDDLSIDVKSTFHKDGHLLFKDIESFRADFAVLVTQEFKDDPLRIVGFCSKRKFASIAFLKDFGKGMGMALQQSDLQPMEILWRHWAGILSGNQPVASF